MGRADAAFSDYWVLLTPRSRPRAWDYLSRMSKPSPGAGRSPGGVPERGRRGRTALLSARRQSCSFHAGHQARGPDKDVIRSFPDLLVLFLFLINSLYKSVSRTAWVAELWGNETG